MMMAVMNVTSASWQDQGVPQVSAAVLRMGRDQWVRSYIAKSRTSVQGKRKRRGRPWLCGALQGYYQ
jgi:hypothetical protein